MTLGKVSWTRFLLPMTLTGALVPLTPMGPVVLGYHPKSHRSHGSLDNFIHELLGGGSYTRNLI